MSFSRNKLAKYRILAKSRALRTALPKTRSFTKSHFRSLLKRYRKVVVKPVGGSGGAGVMSVSAKGRTYKVHYGKKKRTIAGLSAVYSYIKRKSKGVSCIVQRKIALARVNGRPFDARVMVQRSKRSGWVVTGKLAKIAGAGYMITNIKRSKGKVVPLRVALRKSGIGGKAAGRIGRRMDRIALRAARQLRSRYRIRKVGLDAGIDRNGKVWIIEANFRPDVKLFLKLKNKSMYRRIVGFRG
ncbi:YheC/YheD family protein [Paenibacillus sp. GYB003]|uniref:YheC/YheD family protein n=1 Tax=Paenibacillus sp. GYB003 TaxID=2994392 RepID=UPI002F9624A8